jgi:hypothetical protein
MWPIAAHFTSLAGFFICNAMRCFFLSDYLFQ